MELGSTKTHAWVGTGLALMRGVPASPERVVESGPWLESTLEIMALLPPLGVITDLGRLLTWGQFDIARSEQIADLALRAAVDSYEEHLLGRLAADHRLDAARDALLRLPPGLRPAAVAVFIEQILARVGAAETLDSPGPAALRRVLHMPPAELIELGEACLADPAQAPLRRDLCSRYGALARGARRHQSLISDVELFTLENHLALRSASKRLAMAQIAEAAQAIERSLPVRVRRSETSRGRTPTRVEDESTYPIGGYASISTIGGIESLVSSELIYMNPPEERRAGHVDLFDVRWAAGELLKYTRDESVYTRERRTISFALCPDLDRARIKDPQLPWQRLVIAVGGVVAGIRKLCAWLDEAQLHLRLLVIASADPQLGPRPETEQPLAGEAALTQLILREFVESGVFEVLELPDQAAARSSATEAASIGGSDLIWLFGDGPPPRPPGSEDGGRGPALTEHALNVDRLEPLLWLNVNEDRCEPSPRFAHGWDAWTSAFGQLLRALV